MVKIEIDLKVCLKSGQCSYLHPKLFGRDDDDFPVAKIDEPDAELIEGAEQAVELCPAGAIAIVDERRAV